MVSVTSDLYQQIVLEHNRSPRNFGELKSATHSSEGYNPMCGDRIKVYIELEEDKLKDIKFTGESCAICMASASLMTERVKQKTTAEASESFTNFQQLLKDGQKEDSKSKLGKLIIFDSLSRYPARIKCANLGWHTLKAALGGGEVSSNEN